MFLSVAFFAAFASLALAVPHSVSDSASERPILRRGSSCQEPGALKCNGSKKFGICGADMQIVWQSVAAGMACHCSSPGECQMVKAGSGSGSNPSQQPSQEPSHTGHPGHKHQSGSPKPSGSGQPQSSGQPKSPSHPKPSGHPKSSGNPISPGQPKSSGQPQPSQTSSAPSGHYTTFKGDGSTQDGWPSQSEWTSFDALWSGYAPIIGKTCENLPTPVRNNQDSETAELKSAILAKSKQCGVPPEFSLAEVMQESGGCVAVATTSWSHANPGIYQSFEGASCFGKSSCSAQEIQQMAQDGICGTSKGPGFEQDSKSSAVGGSTGAELWYKVARIYNAGSIPSDGDLGAPGATPCYASDIANRLVGNFFDGTSPCTL